MPKVQSKCSLSTTANPLAPKLARYFLLILALYSGAISFAADSTIDIGHAKLNVTTWGTGDTIIALPGAGGDNSRYRYIGPIIARAGYRLIAVNQRGIAGSTGDLEDLDLHDYASDIAAMVDTLELEKVHLIGWALGNRISRVVASDYPDKVASISLIAAGGLVRPLTEPGELAKLLGDADLAEDEKARLARRTLFSPQTDDSLIDEYVRGLRYWNAARASQSAANRNTPLPQWWAGGDGPMLIVQGVDDKTAPPENGERMKAEFGARITLVNLEGAGHLMGMEKPAETAAAILEFLAQHPI